MPLRGEPSDCAATCEGTEEHLRATGAEVPELHPAVDSKQGILELKAAVYDRLLQINGYNAAAQKLNQEIQQLEQHINALQAG